MTKEQIIDKINKLLNVNGRSEEEAKTALAKAQELLAKYNIEQSELGEVKSEIVMRVLTTKTERVSARFESLVTTLASHYRCRVARSYHDIWLCGYEHDVNACEMVVNFAYHTYNEVFDKHYAKQFNTRHDRILAKNSFLVGFKQGCVAALLENEQMYALVLCVPNEVEDYLKEQTDGVGRARHMSGASSFIHSSLVESGYSEGREAFKNKARLTTAQIA